VSQKAATADITLNFSPNGTCDANTSETGVYAVVSRSTRTSIPGYIDIGANNFDDYCFGVQNSPVSALLVGRRTAGQCTANRFVDNDYIMFTLTKYAIGGEVHRLTPTFSSSTSAFSPRPAESAMATSNATAEFAMRRIPRARAPMRATPARADSVDVLAILRTFPWYSAITPEFRHKLELAASGSPSLVIDNADDALAIDYVKGVLTCGLARATATQCALPAPPERLMTK
jgi:hypothetical protein